MADTEKIVASAANVCLSLVNLVDFLKRRGKLLPFVREAAIDRVIAHRVKGAGLFVSDRDLQFAADAIRHQHGLNSATATNDWLAQQGWTAVDFERSLEADLLVEKFKDHLTRDRIADHFGVHRKDYDRALLRLILAAEENLARELLVQIRDEGHEFGDLARDHSKHPSRADGGRIGWVLRRQLPAANAEAVFAAKAGAIVGPLASPQGYQLLLVETLSAADLDAALTALIREELFNEWVKEQMATFKVDLSFLEKLE